MSEAYQRDMVVQELFMKLKCELAVREDNEHVGSGLGGNVSEFMFMILHESEAVATSEEKTRITSASGTDKITIHIPDNAFLKDVRQELTKFINSHPHKLDITKAQAANVSYIKDLQGSTIEKDLLIKGLLTGYDIVSWLDPKIALQEEINKVFEKEYKDVEASFLKEMNLSTDYFDVIKDKYEQNPYKRMFRKHPVWSTKYKEILTREGNMSKQLLSPDDINKMNFIGTMPPHIALFVVRSLIGIQRMVVLNLDEHLKFLDEINKQIESIKYKDSEL